MIRVLSSEAISHLPLKNRIMRFQTETKTVIEQRSTEQRRFQRNWLLNELPVSYQNWRVDDLT